jgi:hypothetical protein
MHFSSTKIWKGRHHLGAMGVDERKTLKRILQKFDVTVRAGFIWLTTGVSGGLQ